MRVFRRRHILPFFPLISAGFSFTTTLTLVYLLNDLFVYYLPIEYRPWRGTIEGASCPGFAAPLQIIVEAILRCNPIKMFLLLAVPFVLAGLGLGVAAVGVESAGRRPSAACWPSVWPACCSEWVAWPSP